MKILYAWLRLTYCIHVNKLDFDRVTCPFLLNPDNYGSSRAMWVLALILVAPHPEIPKRLSSILIWNCCLGCHDWYHSPVVLWKDQSVHMLDVTLYPSDIYPEELYIERLAANSCTVMAQDSSTVGRSANASEIWTTATHNVGLLLCLDSFGTTKYIVKTSNRRQSVRV